MHNSAACLSIVGEDTKLPPSAPNIHRQQEVALGVAAVILSVHLQRFTHSLRNILFEPNCEPAWGELFWYEPGIYTAYQRLLPTHTDQIAV